jgi:hypothetical protein
MESFSGQWTRGNFKEMIKLLFPSQMYCANPGNSVSGGRGAMRVDCSLIVPSSRASSLRHRGTANFWPCSKVDGEVIVVEDEAECAA